MKIAVFGGAFNPPHLGHANLVKSVCDIINPEKVLIIPTGNAPHKTSETCFEDRFEMARLAFPDYEISDIENSREVSYTVDTILKLQKIYPTADFTLIVGADMLADFYKWKDYERLLELCFVIAGGRDHISSSLVRQKLLSGEATDGLISPPVAEYIKRKGLYK